MLTVPGVGEDICLYLLAIDVHYSLLNCFVLNYCIVSRSTVTSILLLRQTGSCSICEICVICFCDCCVLLWVCISSTAAPARQCNYCTFWLRSWAMDQIFEVSGFITLLVLHNDEPLCVLTCRKCCACLYQHLHWHLLSFISMQRIRGFTQIARLYGLNQCFYLNF